MRLADVLGLALSALYKQKVRTALTTLGVFIGSLVLLLSLSIGTGVRQVIAHEFGKHDQLRTVLVYPNYKVEQEDVPAEDLRIKGQVSEERKQRLREAILRRWRGKTKRNPQRGLTPERIHEIEQVPHVRAVVPIITWYGRATLDGRAESCATVAAAPEDQRFGPRLLAGRPFTDDEPHAAIISEYLLYRWGLADDTDVASVVGRKMRIEYRSQRGSPWTLLFLLGGGMTRLNPEEEDVLDKGIRQVPNLLEHFELTTRERETLRRVLERSRPASPPVQSYQLAEEFTITGVIRDPTQQERRKYVWGEYGGDTDLVVPAATLAELYLRVPGNHKMGLNGVTVRVDSEDNVREVEERITNMGLMAHSLATFVDQQRFGALLIAFAMTFVALVALVVAGLGITNTMLMSVLERTREIGVMKAVGARDGHVQMMFLVEGALIGAVGASLGLLCSWLLSFPGDRVAQHLAERQNEIQLDMSVFVFPWWLTLGVPLFVTLLTTLAAFYPARRAARINPITALRHE
jgi:putative ABC transport system permease protein